MAPSTFCAEAGIARISTNTRLPSSGSINFTGKPSASAASASPVQAMLTQFLPALRSSI
ncbi:hypothetical protein D3C84_1305930 [compost metagenome]